MVEVGQRQPRIEDAKFLAFVRSKPCCACGAPPRSQAAHIRIGSIEHGKRNTGVGEKPSDRWCLPLCADCHLNAPDAQHNVGERNFWRRVCLDPFKIASDLYGQFCRRQSRTPEEREALMKRAASIKRVKVRREKRKPTPSRPMQSANRWPAKGSRPFQGRRL